VTAARSPRTTNAGRPGRLGDAHDRHERNSVAAPRKAATPMTMHKLRLASLTMAGVVAVAVRLAIVA
jgi:hypothetical protein